jgi:hypothetical protein
MKVSKFLVAGMLLSQTLSLQTMAAMTAAEIEAKCAALKNKSTCIAALTQMNGGVATKPTAQPQPPVAVKPAPAPAKPQVQQKIEIQEPKEVESPKTAADDKDDDIAEEAVVVSPIAIAKPQPQVQVQAQQVSPAFDLKSALSFGFMHTVSSTNQLIARWMTLKMRLNCQAWSMRSQLSSTQLRTIQKQPKFRSLISASQTKVFKESFVN